MLKKIKVIIIEDNKLLREGIKAMIKEHKDIEVSAALSDRAKIAEQIISLKPDILLLDLGLIHQNSLKLVKSLRKKFPNLKMIVMDLLPIQTEIRQFKDEGVSGFILKDATTAEFMKTIRSVANGEKVYPPQMHGSLFSEVVDNAVDELMTSRLIEAIRMTGTEKKITELISEGKSDAVIAKKLKLNAATVNSHIDNILEKISLNTHVQVAVYKNSNGKSIKSPGLKSKNELKKSFIHNKLKNK
jgi:DNA-binding NarL/FixJ family response regulator